MKYEVNKKKAECFVEIMTQVSSQIYTYTFKNITERFEPWIEIKKLGFKSAEGKLSVELSEKIEDSWLEKGDEQLFY